MWFELSNKQMVLQYLQNFPYYEKLVVLFEATFSWKHYSAIESVSPYFDILYEVKIANRILIPDFTVWVEKHMITALTSTVLLFL